MIFYVEDKEEKKKIAKDILYNLSEWFGLPDSTEEYINTSVDMPFWVHKEKDKNAGFIVLKETSPYTVEIYVMGVLKEFHRKGIGNKLFKAFCDYAKERGYSFIQVKTVKQGKNKDYDKTNAFYKSIGFKEFECFPEFWDSWNPCQIYVMAIK